MYLYNYMFYAKTICLAYSNIYLVAQMKKIKMTCMCVTWSIACTVFIMIFHFVDQATQICGN